MPDTAVAAAVAALVALVVGVAVAQQFRRRAACSDCSWRGPWWHLKRARADGRFHRVFEHSADPEARRG